MKQFAGVTVAILLMCSSVQADDQAALVKGETAALRKDPAGPQIAVLYPQTTVKKGEVREGWVKVTLEGWVKEDELVSSAAQEKAAAQAAALELAGFEIDHLSKQVMGDMPRIRLKLRVKNLGGQEVTSWVGLLTIQALNGKELHRLSISGGKDAIPAHGEREVIFYWSEKEAAYSRLLNYSKDELKLTLSQVRVGK